MAYGLKYTQYISKGGTTLRVNVYAKDWTGTTYGMAHVLGASLQIVGGQADIISPIIKTAFSWSLADAWDQGATQADGTTCVNAQGEKCGRWEEFYTKDATKFRVEVLNGSTVIWQGYVTPDSWTEEMQFHGSVTITARDMLGALQDSEFDLTGRVTVLDVVQGALEACSCPMELYYVPAHFLVNENGQSILAHDFAASTFSGRNWYQALEDTLDSLGLVLRYNGAGQIVLTSLRYLAADTLQGHHEVAYANRSGLRSLDPAIKLITETFDLERTSYVPKDPDASQFTATGGTITCSMTVTRPGSTPQTATGIVKAYTLTRTGSEGWSGTLGIPMYGTAESGAVIRGIYFPCGTQDVSNTLEAVYTNTRLDRAFRFSLALDGGLMQVTNGATTGAVFKAPLTSSFIYVPDVTIRVQCEAEGVTRYLNSEGVWVTDLTYRSIQLGETVTVPMQTNGTNYQIVVKRVNLAGTGRPLAPLVAPLLLEVGPDDNATSPTEYKITTNYDQENNVTITRSPVIGSADVAECPEFIANALGYDDVIVSNKWNWPGETSYFPLAVMIQAQVLCFYAAAASVFTGTAVDRAADFALPGYAFDYYSRRGVPVSGVYDLSSGFAVQSTVREVYSWEEVWGESFAPEYTQISGAGKGSTSATGSGGSSSGGGGGGGSIAPGVSMAAVQEWVNGQGFATETWVTAKGYLTGITDDMIADALGYTPLAPDDLLGYATQSWVRQQGYITGITATDIETALDYIPVSPTDLTTALGGYLPLTAGTAKPLTGDLYIITGDTDKCIQFSYDTRHLAGAAWRIISEGSGNLDANYLSFQTGGSSASATTWETVLRMTMDTRRVGINTTPSYQLDVNGPTRVTSLRIGTTTNAAASLLEWDETNRAWKLTGNFYATGWISAGGLSSGGGSEGASLAAVWASLKTNSDDYANEKIDVAHIPALASLSGNLTVSRISDIETWISGKGYLTDHQSLDGYVNDLTRTPASGGNYVSAVTKSGKTITVTYATLPTSLPASDVYSWAKAETKPSYAFSEITGTASTSQIPTLAISKISGLQDALNGKQASDADLTAIAGLTGTSGFLKKTAANTWALDTNTYLTGITSTMVTNALGYTPANSTALSNYVLKSGDTMTGALTVSAQVIPVSMEFRNMSSSAGNGGYIDFHFNNSSADFTTRIIESASGILSISGGLSLGTTLQLGNGVLSWDGSANAWKLTGNFYATGFISAGGVSSGGGSEGVNLTAVWDNLIANTGEGLNKKIHTAHLPTVTISGTNISGTATYSGTGGSASTLTLNLTATDTTYSAGTGISLNGTTFSLATSGVTAGTYYKTTVDTYGRVTSGSYANLSAAINGDLTEGTSNPTDEDFYIAQYAGGGTSTTSYHRRPHSALYNYINGKLASAHAGLDKVGTVTSVAMTVPTGLSVSGTPITTSGTLAISFASGYSIPTTAKQSNWDTAYGWGNHADVGYLTENQTISLSGDVSGRGKTSIAVTIGTGKVTNAMLAGSIANGKLANSAITINGSSTSLGGSFSTASITAGTAGQSTASSGVSFSIPYVTMNAYGIVTGYGTHTHTISAQNLYDTIGSTKYAPYNSAGYLPLSGGTMTGPINLTPGQANIVIAGSDTSILYGAAGTSSSYGEAVFGMAYGATYLRGQGDPIWRQYNSVGNYDQHTIYHAGNANLATIAWKASTFQAGSLSQYGASSIELNTTSSTGHGGFIDFHYNGSTADYTSRIIENASGRLAITGQLAVADALSCASLTATSADFRLTNFYDFHIFRNNSGGAAGITYYPAAQTTNYWNVGADPSIYGDTRNYRFYWYCNGAYVAYLTTTGSFVANGAITAGSASDARLKTNIQSLSAEAAKRIVMALNPVTFTWNEKATELYDQYKGDDLGFVAQEVEGVLPVAIGTIFEKYKRLDQTKFIAPLVAVAQDHESRIRQLEAENKELRKRLNMN